MGRLDLFYTKYFYLLVKLLNLKIYKEAELKRGSKRTRRGYLWRNRVSRAMVLDSQSISRLVEGG